VLYRGILGIGVVSFLLDGTKLPLDEIETLAFPFKLAAQAFG
jgi:hypothetical protein